MNILFYPYHLGYMSSRQAITPATGVPMSVPYTMSDMKKDLHGATHNVGNIIHVEAPARMLEYDSFGSASTFLIDMARHYDNDPIATAREISRRFDYVVVSEANVFRWHGSNKEESEKRTRRLRVNADILDNLTIPFVVLGAGMQNPPPDNLDEFDANIAYFIRVIERKAVLIGVRGRATRDWLARAGVKRNVKALGCPSMFLYPKNIRSIQYIPLSQQSRVLTAGYLDPHHINYEKPRVELTSQLASMFNVDFLMQDDFYKLLEGQNLNHYDEATGMVDRNYVVEKLKISGFDASAFKNFYHFRNSYAWRVFSSTYNLYIGDRLHGGICAMQSSRPAVIMYNDSRVRELADFFQFPSVSVQSAIKNGIAVELEKSYTPEAIDIFKNTYESMYSNFRDALNDAGLKLRVAR